MKNKIEYKKFEIEKKLKTNNLKDFKQLTKVINKCTIMQ